MSSTVPATGTRCVSAESSSVGMMDVSSLRYSSASAGVRGVAQNPAGNSAFIVVRRCLGSPFGGGHQPPPHPIGLDRIRSVAIRLREKGGLSQSPTIFNAYAYVYQSLRRHFHLRFRLTVAACSPDEFYNIPLLAKVDASADVVAASAETAGVDL